MHYKTIEQLQEAYGFKDLQESINSGQVWRGEGSGGRYAMAQLESGAVMLPKVPRLDYYGNRVPSRADLKAGTKGTFKNSQNFWQMVEDGDIIID